MKRKFLTILLIVLTISNIAYGAYLNINAPKLEVISNMEELDFDEIIGSLIDINSPHSSMTAYASYVGDQVNFYWEVDTNKTQIASYRDRSLKEEKLLKKAKFKDRVSLTYMSTMDFDKEVWMSPASNYNEEEKISYLRLINLENPEKPLELEVPISDKEVSFDIIADAIREDTIYLLLSVNDDSSGKNIEYKKLDYNTKTNNYKLTPVTGLNLEEMEVYTFSPSYNNPDFIFVSEVEVINSKDVSKEYNPLYYKKIHYIDPVSLELKTMDMSKVLGDISPDMVKIIEDKLYIIDQNLTHDMDPKEDIYGDKFQVYSLELGGDKAELIHEHQHEKRPLNCQFLDGILYFFDYDQDQNKIHVEGFDFENDLKTADIDITLDTGIYDLKLDYLIFM